MAGLTVKVKYACVDGMHMFTPGDDLSNGLFAGSEDAATAYKEVSYQLNYLFEKNLKKKTDFKPAIPFEVFERWLKALAAASEQFKGQPELKTIPSANVGWAAAA